FGHVYDPTKDFGFGERRRVPIFAKSGSFPPVTGMKFDDGGWKRVDLPHDWAVELPFENTPSFLTHHGANPLGREYPETSIGWYRRVFDLPSSDSGKRIRIEFDGVFRNAMVIFNGHYLGENFSGYAPFSFDVTDFVNFGDKNVLAVRVDATLGEGWFYEGAGIYRHVWLTKTEPIHVRQWGNYVRSEVHGTGATLFISTEVENESEQEKACRVSSRMVDDKGKTTASEQSKPAKVEPWGSKTSNAQATISKPRLWSLEEPPHKMLIATLEKDDEAADQVQ